MPYLFFFSFSASPSRPKISVRQRSDFTSFIVRIDNFSPCIIQYSLRVTDSQGMEYNGVIPKHLVSSNNEIDVKNVTRNIQVNLCKLVYTVVVVSNYYNVLESSRPQILHITFIGK